MKLEHYILIALCIIIIATSIFIFKKLKNQKQNKQYNENILKILNNLGGEENIISVTPKMSRVEFVLKNYDLVNKEELKLLGVQGISKTSQKITLVVGSELAKDLEQTFKRN